MVQYGQVVVGPPGAGKTTFCHGMQHYLELLGRKRVCVVNLDPANEGCALPYQCDYNVCDTTVQLSSVMAEFGLGPNGGLLYCMEYLERHGLDDLVAAIQDYTYIIIDCPGQVELYTHSQCVSNILSSLNIRLTVVQMVDGTYCHQPTQFLSAALLSTTTLLRLELPTVCVLSKVDLLVNNNTLEHELPLPLEFFTDCHDLDRLVPFLNASAPIHTNNEDDDGLDAILNDPAYQRARLQTQSSPLYVKHQQLHAAIAELVQDFGLLRYSLLDISDAESVGRVLAQIDKANGYAFSQSNSSSNNNNQTINETLFACAMADTTSAYEVTAAVRERLDDR